MGRDGLEQVKALQLQAAERGEWWLEAGGRSGHVAARRGAAAIFQGGRMVIRVEVMEEERP